MSTRSRTETTHLDSMVEAESKAQSPVQLITVGKIMVATIGVIMVVKTPARMVPLEQICWLKVIVLPM